MIYISEKKHLNLDAFSIENEYLDVKVLKDFGAKICSIRNKNPDYEFLFQPTKKFYEKPKFGDDFSKYDTSGADEMLPTIDKCLYPNTDIILPDHGDLWALKWENIIIDDYLKSSVNLKSLDLKFSRNIRLSDSKIILEYELINLSDMDIYYLWAFHGLLNFDDATEISISKNIEIENVIDFKKYDFDYTLLREYPDKGQYKFYFKNPLDNGEIEAIFRNQALKLRYEFDENINKYLGFWITKGGFKGEYNFAIEPASGYYDSLDTAIKNDKITMIKANSKINWNLNIIIDNLR
ncbi:MAG: hypothetical protein Q4P29_04560 [Tissierellia bacterium]|nr:hypothetical protein [Tissierellia bacterium]